MTFQTSSRAPASGPTVAVYGASGHTGRFVLRELLRRGLTPLAIGRERAALVAAAPAGSGLAIRVAAADDAAALDNAFEGAAAVINCAGPFLDTAAGVLQAALRARIHYLDVSAEQASVQALFESQDGAARAAGIVALPAMGFYGGLGDLLASAVSAGWDAIDEIRIAIALSAWWPTPGTRRTGARNTAPRLTLAGGRLVPLPDPARCVRQLFPEPFGAQDLVELPFSEVILIARHLPVARLDCLLNQAPLRDLRDASTPPPAAIDASGMSGQLFAVDVTASGPRGRRRVTAMGRDIYAFTAPLVVEAACRILSEPGLPPGVRAPGELFDARGFLAALEGDGFALDYHS